MPRRRRKMPWRPSGTQLRLYIELQRTERPQSVYQLFKNLGVAYSAVHRAVLDLEHMGFVNTRKVGKYRMVSRTPKKLI